MFDFSIESIIGYLYAIPGVLFALSVHEFSHGFIANKFGDPTAKNMGRLTLNPIKHIDVFGLIAMFVVGVGWAKPVPINSRYFKKPKRDIALTAIAGPLSNFIFAFIATILYYFFMLFVFKSEVMNVEIITGVIMILQNVIFLNIGLGVFNLIPIPPLDGSRILDSFLPPKALIIYHRYEDIIRIVLLFVLIFDIFSIYPAVDYIYFGMAKIVEFIFENILNLVIQ